MIARSLCQRIWHSTTSNGFVIRKATSLDDLKLLSQLFEKNGWALGRNELRCAFCTDPSGFFVGELDGKIISYISVMKYNHFAYWSNLVVEDTYHGKGYARQMLQAAENSVGEDFNIGLTSLQDMVGVYEKKGFTKAWVDREYVVSASNTVQVLSESPVAAIKDITGVDLCAYDTNVFGAPRQKYLEALLTTLPESIAFAAVNDKGLLGYAWCEKMLQEEKGVRIGPLFADDKRIAQGLLQAISKTVISRNPHIDTEMTLVVPDINQAAINLIENELFGKSDFQQPRMFSKGIPAKMNLPKIFAISSLDLG